MGKKINASEHNVHIEFTVVCTRPMIRKIIDRLVSMLDKFGIQTTVMHQEITEPESAAVTSDEMSSEE